MKVEGEAGTTANQQTTFDLLLLVVIACTVMNGIAKLQVQGHQVVLD
jgi:hypothetical protein